MTEEEQTPRKKNVIFKEQKTGAERFWALRDRKDSRGGHPAVADRNAGLLAGLAGLPRGCSCSG